MTHTPGPWKVEKELGSRNWLIALDAGEKGRGIDLAETRSGVFRDVELANARLIAAAPELLAVLQELQESAAYWSEYEVPLGIVDRINDAIRKATGDKT